PPPVRPRSPPAHPVPPPVARAEDHRRPVVDDEDERLDDLPHLALARFRGLGGGAGGFRQDDDLDLEAPCPEALPHLRRGRVHRAVQKSAIPGGTATSTVSGAD